MFKFFLFHLFIIIKTDALPETCLNGCICLKNLRLIDCADQNLFEVPRLTFNTKVDYRSFSLRNNKLTFVNITEIIMAIPTIEYIDLRGNSNLKCSLINKVKSGVLVKSNCKTNRFEPTSFKVTSDKPPSTNVPKLTATTAKAYSKDQTTAKSFKTTSKIILLTEKKNSLTTQWESDMKTITLYIIIAFLFSIVIVFIVYFIWFKSRRTTANIQQQYRLSSMQPFSLSSQSSEEGSNL